MVGIYKIQSKIYIDRTYYGRTIDFDKRKQQHIILLNKNKHHSKILQNHVNKYGINDLFFELVETCSIKDLEAVEQRYIDLNNYFNVSTSSIGGRGIKEITNIKKLPLDEKIIILKELISKGDVDAIRYYLELRYGKPKKMNDNQMKNLIILLSNMNKSN